MRYPSINRTASRQVAVPKFLGTNLDDPLNLVDDNQLTDSLNVWEESGVIKTRPAMKNSSFVDFSTTLTVKMGDRVYIPDFSFIREGIKYKVIVEDKRCHIQIGDTSTRALSITAVSAVGKLWEAQGWYQGETVENLCLFEGRTMHAAGMGIFLMIGSTLYELTDHNDENYVQDDFQRSIYSVTSDYNYTFDRLLADEIYSPIVLINGKGELYSTLPVSEDADYAAASTLEGYNVIDGAWQRFMFVTDGVSADFVIPTEEAVLECQVEHTDTDKKKYIYKGTGTKLTCETNSSLTCEISGNKFTFKKNGTTTALPSSLNAISNNLVIKVKLSLPSGLTGATISEWFGGESEGINGGVRLFVAGNGSRICYSDAENHSYFPIYNYMYVGSGNVTALKKQSNMLVIFKESEIWYTTHNIVFDYTAEDVVNSSYDIATGSVLLPLVMLHGEIGCDLPSSIQLCGDRLIWANKTKKVYMLKNANQYSTANIAVVSGMIDGLLRKQTFGIVSSTTYNGYYLLQIGETTFVLDYDAYYFSVAPK